MGKRSRNACHQHAGRLIATEYGLCAGCTNIRQRHAASVAEERRPSQSNGKVCTNLICRDARCLHEGSSQGRVCKAGSRVQGQVEEAEQRPDLRASTFRIEDMPGVSAPLGVPGESIW